MFCRRSLLAGLLAFVTSGGLAGCGGATGGGSQPDAQIDPVQQEIDIVTKAKPRSTEPLPPGAVLNSAGEIEKPVSDEPEGSVP
jgi:hypothetical protein